MIDILSTPLARACKPGYIAIKEELVCYTTTNIESKQDVVNTIRAFLSIGEDIEDALKNCCGASSALFYYDVKNRSCEPLLFDYVLTTVGARAFTDNWWMSLLTEMMYMNDFTGQATANVLRFCNQSIARTVLLEELSRDFNNEPSDYYHRLNYLIEKSGGLSFLHTRCFSPGCHPISPIDIMTKTSLRFSKFKNIIERLQFDKEDIIRAEFKLPGREWTEQTLRRLFEYPISSFHRLMYHSFRCKKCNFYKFAFQINRAARDVPWQLKVKRIKDGLDPDGPLTEEETLELEKWNGYVKAHKQRICENCHEKDLENEAQEEEYGLGLNCFSIDG